MGHAVGMDYGLFNINNNACADPDVADRVAQAAEGAGFESVWTGEHVVLPDPQVPPSPMPPDGLMLDPVAALSFIAAHTRTIKLGTGIIILPQRNPLVLAKELASLDVLSKGRLIFGIGAGYLEPEFRALGIPMEDRGDRTVEYMEAMRAIWDMDQPEYHGRFVDFAGVQANPRPVQRPTPPMVMGGHTAPAFRRAITHCQGWYGFGLDLERTSACLAGLHEAADRYERPAGLGALQITVTPRGRVDPALADSFGELGVHRLVLLTGGKADGDGLVALVEEAGQTLIRR